jgi:EAL domain-containing protein (putative c-di-GMP-specific phosphodiesterase class I)
LRGPVEVDGVAITVRASIGVVHWPADGHDAETLLRRADAAMYRAKTRGGTWRRYVDEDELGAARRLELAGDLPAALDQAQIELFFQPMLELSSKRCVMVETLVRWRHPKHGLVMPGEFVPLAEQYGLGLTLCRYVLGLSLAQAKTWRRAGLTKAVTINVSVYTLLEANFVGLVAAALGEAGLPGEALLFELTEDAFAAQTPELLEVLTQLNGVGVGMAIDDFGAGYSSLSYLRGLPVGTLKLDRSFAAGLDSGNANDVIVSSTIDLAHRLGVRVVAEGVETEEALQALGRYGCDAAQGYWVCSPGTPWDVTRWLTKNRGRRKLPAAGT